MLAVAMICMWESLTAKNFPLTVEKRCAASCAISMEPPWPIQSTLSASVKIRTALRICSVLMRFSVSVTAARSAE